MEKKKKKKDGRRQGLQTVAKLPASRAAGVSSVKSAAGGATWRDTWMDGRCGGEARRWSKSAVGPGNRETTGLIPNSRRRCQDGLENMTTRRKSIDPLGNGAAEQP